MSNNTNKQWDHDLKIGAQGEATFTAVWQNCFGTTPKDVRHDPAYQHRDIDYLVTDGLHDYIGAEIKTDLKDMPNRVLPSSGSFLIETVKNLNSNKSGWIYETDAQLLVMVKQQVNRMYLLNAHNLVNYVRVNEQRYLNNHWYYDAATRKDDGTVKYKSRNLIIARADLFDAGVFWRVCILLGNGGEWITLGAADLDADKWFELCTSPKPTNMIIDF